MQTICDQASSMDIARRGLRTRVVHAGEARLEGSVAAPVFRSSTYALGEPDAAVLQMLSEQMGEGDFRFDELMLQLVESDMFRFRRQEEV